MIKNSLLISFLILAIFFVYSCRGIEQAYDPTRLRTDYGNSLEKLYLIIEDTNLRLGDSMNGQEYKIAMKYAQNLQNYANDLKNVTPKNRTTYDIERFDALADSIRDIAIIAEYYAKKHMHIKGMREVRSLRGNIRVLNTYLGQPRPDEGVHFKERIEFYPEDRARVAGAEIR